MNTTKYTLALSLTGLVSLPAAVVTLSTPDINGGVSTTSSFSDGNLTLTPLQGTSAATFNAHGIRLGIDDFGTNANSFNDPDTDPNNGNEEKLQFDFAPTVGLSSISYDFSRADGTGANDGVIISGFTADPGVTFSISNANLFAVYNAGSVRLNLPGSLFDGTETFINFDPAASAGQTLLLSVTDTTQAGAQLAIRSISYDTIPEPSSTALLALGGLALLRRRR
ncbi:PEP-CTERM sorting domain-containing protein [Roseibacillus persicicus]|uniref:PEP-CTERM sorting domain-containing protein n=1 Tax=Roseibacillus persicicus TaxID=454148 RepID=UPI00280F051C|nr:PEP-CTERM sorting domain-containing protein [Roseibacillus persicicus]MDQ8191562.1 PEP-CTERM sorting domain-containing protein [Roseibacillus persicicus]